MSETKKSTEPTKHASLWEALLAAQADYQHIERTARGQRGAYAPLDVVLDMARPILNKHRILLTQPTFIEDGNVFIRTTLIWVDAEAGEETRFEIDYPVGPTTLAHPQLGGNLTYARRYSLLTILGVHPDAEDDDGEKAGPAGHEPPPRAAPRRPSPPPAPKVRAAAEPFINNATEMLDNAKGSEDSVWAAFDAIKAKPGWKALTEAEQAIIHRARLAAMPPEPETPDDMG